MCNYAHGRFRNADKIESSRGGVEENRLKRCLKGGGGGHPLVEVDVPERANRHSGGGGGFVLV
jgi:hypothetical protein